MADDVCVDPVVIEPREAGGTAVHDERVDGIEVTDADVEVHLLRVGGIGPPGPRIVGQSLVEHELRDVPPIEMEEIRRRARTSRRGPGSTGTAGRCWRFLPRRGA